MSESNYQNKIYASLHAVNDVSQFYIGKEWRLAIPSYLHKVENIDLSGLSIAEVGCGSGYFSCFIASNYHIKEVDLYDIAASAGKLVETNFQHASSALKCYKYRFFAQDVQDGLNFAEHYDVVFAMGAVHHASNLNSYFRRIFNSLKDGGLFICNEPSYPENIDESALESFYAQKLGSTPGNEHLHRLDYFYRPSEYMVTARLGGFELLNQIYWCRDMAHLLNSFDNIQADYERIYSNSLKRKLSAQDDVQSLIDNPNEHLYIFKKSSQSKRVHHDLLGIESVKSNAESLDVQNNKVVF